MMRRYYISSAAFHLTALLFLFVFSWFHRGRDYIMIDGFDFVGNGGFGGFGSYLKILRQRIWSEWTQSAVYGTGQVCIVGLTISRAGEVSDIQVEKPSGNSFYDNVAMRAVRNSSPLPPLPSSFSKD